ncbi:PREDICTED: transcription factor BIM1-like isoform X2 [Populus euphratica]|uniref:Transcription factor BIM1-like isoform X2 n=1 Tax=Populus euphratica TaxID=75702 RepID=A0AAJ6T134_POPEU|nr:PREDICTED: transcription factor BIM1-like isoform X2 [Populus euphratica]XP_011002241.1 PREDICTED: transcription factor BIM1-like isoform X2 [Populus euphratica]
MFSTGSKPKHDLLSLYRHSSTVQQDPRPPCQGGYLKTHDFLQPLERGGKTTAKEITNVEVLTVEKPPPPAPPPAVEHILPGGIGTYSISQISYFNQRVPKPENTIFLVAQDSSTDKNDDNSNCSSYSGSGFTLWEESVLKKGKTGKENVGERSNIIRGSVSVSQGKTRSNERNQPKLVSFDGFSLWNEAALKMGEWTTSERPSQSSSNNHRNSFNSISTSQLAGRRSTQSFIEMIKSAKGCTLDDDVDDEEEFLLKKETPSPIRKGELRVKVDGKSNDQKPDTPRSKHSATEQRRRSKINDRFQMLRELIPRGDQKKDKASFLLEVIEYIQFLQEKVQKYEASYQGWNHETTKLVPWKNNSRPVESSADQSRGLNSGAGPALLFAAKLDERNITISPSINPGGARNPVESDMTSANAMDRHPGFTNKSLPFPISLQPNFNPGRTAGAAAQFPPRLPSDAENLASQTQPQSCHARSWSTDEAVASDKLKEKDLTVEGGTISISNAYSQGLVNTLTLALQSSGVDLSRASISVQIELGKTGNSGQTASTSITKDNNVLPSNKGTTRSRVSGGEESVQELKKLKTSKASARVA